MKAAREWTKEERKVTSIIMPSGLWPSPLDMTDRDPRCSTPPSAALADCCGLRPSHLRSDETDLARRRAGIIDFQHCVTVAPGNERNSLADRWPEPAKHNGQCLVGDETQAFVSLPSPQMVLQHVRLCLNLFVRG